MLAPERAPYPRAPFAHVGYWQRVLAGPRGKVVLAQWSAACEVQFTYLVTTGKPELRQLFPQHPALALGWTSEGLARVELLEPIHGTRTRIGMHAGIYLVTPRGHVVRLERRLPPARGC